MAGNFFRRLFRGSAPGNEALPAWDPTFEEAAQRIVAVNFADFEVARLTGDWELVLSPIWEPGPDGRAVRRITLLKRSMRAHYYEGNARRLLESTADLALAVVALSQRHDDLGMLHTMYCAEDAPYVPLEVRWNEHIAGASLLVAAAARLARVGLSAEQIKNLEVAPEATAAAFAEIARIEEELAAQMAFAPVEELVDALNRRGRPPLSPPKRAH